VIGIVLFGAALLIAVGLGSRACRLLHREGKAELEILTRGLLIGGCGMLVAFAFLTAQYEKQLWIVLGFLLVAHALARAPPSRET
jgi:hypothetical protein